MNNGVTVESFNSHYKIGAQDNEHIEASSSKISPIVSPSSYSEAVYGSLSSNLSKPISDGLNTEETRCVASSPYPSLDASLNELTVLPTGKTSCTFEQRPEVKQLPVHRTTSLCDISERARRFSELSSPTIIQVLCREHVPQWNTVQYEDICVDQLMFGLSNQLFKVEIRETVLSNKITFRKVLFRIYGKDVDSLYDSSMELKVFKLLGERGVAPKLIGEFQGGRIEEWIEGGPLQSPDMKIPSVIAGVATILAGIHSLNLSSHLNTTPILYTYLDRWREGAMRIYNSVTPEHPNYRDFQRMDLPRLYEESLNLNKYLFPEGAPTTPVTQITFCHNDVQENNILITSDAMRLIDYEYSGYNYPAYDIASYFWEMTCDYCADSYPFFRIDASQYPTEEERRLFCAVYLSEYLNKPVNKSNLYELNSILDVVERFQLATHMLWGFWSIIRVPQAATATEFDMLYYAQKRFDHYWSQKAKLLTKGKIHS